ncbi:MAG: hypothetical protein FWH27_13030, partial [Planctomycetaceae bacterium]|nr:hypothetical protein [Planctomycetaceae bacterium]
VFATLFAAYHAYMVWYVRLIYSNDTKLMAFYLICMVLAPVYVTLNSIRVNRKWRQCVEFGSEAEVKEPTSGHMYPAEGCIPDGMQMENYGGTFSTERSIPTECLPVEYNPLKCRPLKCNPLGLQRSVETTSQQTTLHSLGMRPPVEKPENHNRERLHEPHVISRINVIILLGIAFVFNSILYGIFVYMGFFLINANLSYWDRGLLLSFPTALIIFL